jgi:hypothetical protein
LLLLLSLILISFAAVAYFGIACSALQSITYHITSINHHPSHHSLTLSKKHKTPNAKNFQTPIFVYGQTKLVRVG